MGHTNDVKLFSNGIGHFRRVYKVKSGQEEKISIPFKRSDIGDVAASLQVFGHVRMTTPPSFTPSNANATALNIIQSEAQKSLFRSLSGAAVKVTYTNGASQDYTLLGLDVENITVEGTVVEKDYLVVMDGGSVKRTPLNEVENVEFTEASVRTEIEKALKNNFQLIKPDSTLMDLSLTSIGDSDEEATVQYTIPVAAWKMRYAIREEKGKFSLEGAAIIDNNTDEDWEQFRVSVVTGNPISFATDIANIVVPQRKMVHLVDGQVQGNVQVEQGYAALACAGFSPASAPKGGMAMRAANSAKMSTANYAQFGLESCDEAAEFRNGPVAETPGVDAKDVGDFCVFTSKEPITILARKSAVVPMFSVPLTKAGVVLLYKESNNARRPFRTIKIKNETEYSLGKGKTIVYNEGVFSGECVLESTKPGENRMLPHCVENGVKITKEAKNRESKLSSLKFSAGIAVQEHVFTASTVYTIENKKDEAFKLAVEHVNTLGNMTNTNVDFDGVEVKEKEKLIETAGYRVYIELAPKQSITMTVTETAIHSQQINIGGYFNWVQANVIATNNPLAQDKGIIACVKIQEKIDEVETNIANLEEQRDELNEQLTRVRDNIAAVKGNEGNKTTITEWGNDLDATDKMIRNIDKKELPKARKTQEELSQQLQEALKNISATWSGLMASEA